MRLYGVCICMNNEHGLYVVVREDSGYEVARLTKNGGWLFKGGQHAKMVKKVGYSHPKEIICPLNDYFIIKDMDYLIGSLKKKYEFEHSVRYDALDIVYVFKKDDKKLFDIKSELLVDISCLIGINPFEVLEEVIEGELKEKLNEVS